MPQSQVKKTSSSNELCVIGLDLGATKLHATIADLHTTIISRRHHLLAEKGISYLEELILATVDDLSSVAKEQCRVILGVGLAVPGTRRYR